MNHLNKLNSIKKARRRVSMRSALLLTLCACLLTTTGRIALLFFPSVVRPLPELLLTLLAFGAGAYLGLCVLDGDQRKTVVRKALDREQILFLSLLGVLCVCPATLANDLVGALFSSGAQGQASGMAQGGEAALFLVVLLKSGLVAPVCEELFFRGYLLGALRRSTQLRAVWVSALCFALAHGVTAGSLVVHVLLGILFGVVLLRTESVYASMLVHGCYNASVVLISYAGLSPLFTGLSLGSCLVRLAGCAAFAAVLKRVYMLRPGTVPKTAPEEWDLSKKEKILLISALVMTALAAVIAGVLA
ncbi:MAG: CPBP family intramembrane metalloprotease [Clostridia bacterium]|nr:CPBP family intramembrane metalloprotease [Clostridia bacterium]